MIALVDTNVVLDVMLARQDFVEQSKAVIAAVETGRCRGFLCASAITTIHYIARRQVGTERSLSHISPLLSLFDIAPINRAIVVSSLSRDFSDFEDAVLHEAALQSGANCIVTRNIVDFRTALMPVYTPAQFMEALNDEQKNAGN